MPRSLNPQGLDVCAPVMVEHGTDEQRERWTLPTLWGDITWCLAVSHEGVLPGEAIRPGFQLTQRDRELVVSGREPAPPGAQHADWCLCAAQVVGRIRGGPEDLAVLVVDLRATGVAPAPARGDRRRARPRRAHLRRGRAGCRRRRQRRRRVGGRGGSAGPRTHGAGPPACSTRSGRSRRW